MLGWKMAAVLIISVERASEHRKWQLHVRNVEARCGTLGRLKGTERKMETRGVYCGEMEIE
jgi:hypothetical protein